LPTWNPAGTEIAFVQLDAVGLGSAMSVRGESHVYERGDASIVAVDLNGQTSTLYGPTRDWIADLGWSPARDWIAFTYETETAVGLAVIRPDGTGRTRVTSFLSDCLDAG
jgi:Tol biopolymer transport system component